jgi:hypothetical protein
LLHADGQTDSAKLMGVFSQLLVVNAIENRFRADFIIPIETIIVLLAT